MSYTLNLLKKELIHQRENLDWHKQSKTKLLAQASGVDGIISELSKSVADLEATLSKLETENG